MHKQIPVGTPSGSDATADHVLDGLDLSGSNAVVTGGHGGIGIEVTRALAKAGARVTVAARDAEKGAARLEHLRGVEVEPLDLIDPASIDAFVRRWRVSGQPLHILVNNAGASGEPARDTRGYDTQFATNHLGHFQLTLGLHDALCAAGGARVVNVTSGAHRASDIQWDDLHLAGDHAPIVGYAQSKTANVLFAVELDRRWKDQKIRSYAVHPGVVVGTGMSGRVSNTVLQEMGLVDERGNPIIDPQSGKKTTQQAASTIVFAAGSPLLSGIGGVYLKDNDISPVDDRSFDPASEEIIAEVAPHAINPVSASKLWEISEALLRS
ncbi:SDR family NAD(P)-dependent oxidoreductase [Acidimangrovimonas sediminis]|uniref:SDR family NAD(P)-dependent oxidoreductase n=1 Tax=Acidimangrovimonas sediminis TaxID=2056283 RepID=UPI000C80475C|nr:SDR family NAD(P)-dependent oxidoreductase [Acidimangrovimonas sediminis]